MIKINNELKLGIQSWSFRGLENGNQDISKALKECNIDSLEITQKHVNFQNEQEVDSVIKFYKNNEITLSSCGVCRFVSDKKSNRNIFNFAKKAGIKAISANIDEDALNICEKLCEEYDIKLAIHNHGKNHLYGTYERLDKVFSKSSKNIGLCIDLGWMLHAGHDPLEALNRYKSRIFGIHFKDFIMDDDNFKEVILGKGDLDLKSCIDLIKNMNTLIYASIEYEEDEKNPVPGTKCCIEAIEQYL